MKLNMLIAGCLVALGLVFLDRDGMAAQPSRPFPQHVAYAAGSIKPNHVDQATMDAAVGRLYTQWKNGFLRSGCASGHYHVWHGGYGGGGTAARTVSVSEGHGYGMIIAALMAGRDPAAQTIFNGFHAYFRAHPSRNHKDLMAWQQLEGCIDSKDADSATDGDLDIAYALLLAHRQWGSGETVDYKAEALKVIAAIRAKEVNPTSKVVQLGDWVDPGQKLHYHATRSSDWMPGHFKAFDAAAGGGAWAPTVNATYGLLATMQRKFAPATGLVPDFVVRTNATPVPAAAGFLGEETGDKYGWNACRVPWRIGADFLHSGDRRAYDALRKLEDWAVAKTGRNPAKLRAVYTLAGKPVETYSDLAFTAPIAVGAMIDPHYQTWLNALWDELVNAGFDRNDYYGNTLRLLAVLMISGNWWAP